MSKKKDLNPELDNYIDESGNKMRLDDLVKIEVYVLSNEYIEKFGHRPSKKLIISWMQRIKHAYNNGVITTVIEK